MICAGTTVRHKAINRYIIWFRIEYEVENKFKKRENFNYLKKNQVINRYLFFFSIVKQFHLCLFVLKYMVYFNIASRPEFQVAKGPL